MLKYWVAADLVGGVGPIKLKKLLEQYRSIEEVCQIINAPIEQAEKLVNEAKQKGVSLLSLADNEYPELLKNIYDPPPVLYFKGQPLNPNEKTIAIVGTRKASHYGLATAKKLSYELACLGFTIVSGMALGIDTAAHQGALEARGKTIAVLGCGVDIIYPPSNKGLASEIEKNGALVSEFPLGTGTEKGHFPRRNRIISGLSLGTIVVEGHYDSGAMITAKQALDQGREVFAVPGNIGFEQAKGPHWLIKQGAKLVESVDDVLEEFGMIIPEHRPQSTEHPSTPLGASRTQDYAKLSEAERKIVAVLSLEPKYIDNISIETGFSMPQVSSLLMMLEVKKVVKQLPGKMFVLY